MNTHLRKPAVAGQFYPGTARLLKAEIARLMGTKAPQCIDAVACIMPHAGYQYSGAVAAATISRVKMRDTVVLLGPNHTGYGMPLSIMCEGEWETPLGTVSINSGFARELVKNAPYLQHDSDAHAREHSLEVQVPFLQFLKPDVSIVPIVIGEDVPKVLEKLAADIAATIIARKEQGRVLIIASSDMTHYEPLDRAREKDRQAIDAILKLDGALLYERVRGLDISMCGYAPAICGITAAKALGASKAELVDYRTSGEVTGDNDSVVGYAGVIIY